MMNLAAMPASRIPLELQQNFFYPSVYFPDADEGSVVDMLNDRANQNDQILAAMKKTEFDPDHELIEPDYDNEDMIVDDEGPDGPVVRDQYTIVEPLKTEPVVKTTGVGPWGVHYDIKDKVIPPKVGKQSFSTPWGKETVTTSVIGGGAPKAKVPARPRAASHAKKAAIQHKKQMISRAARHQHVMKKAMQQSQRVAKAARITAQAVAKRRALAKKVHASRAGKKTLHAKVIKRIYRKRGVAKGKDHVTAARKAIHKKFRTVKAKKINKKLLKRKVQKKSPARKLAANRNAMQKKRLAVRKVGAKPHKKIEKKKRVVVKKNAPRDSKIDNIKRAISKKYKTIKVTKRAH